jgi:hypothetical protein
MERLNQGRCSFCAVPDDVPSWRLAVGAEANICSDCVALVSDVLTQQAANADAVGWQHGTLEG